ncbi:MAG TPA: hypothetical protein ENJ05_09045 [Thiotrichales bacterium]|nr:hypothetical protein [Thiotrichales bacterium]
MKASEQRLLFDLLSIPTAPFREQQVRNHAMALLDRWRIPHCLDPFGNLMVGVASTSEYRRLLASRDDEPLRLFIAHMDHPGFHGRRWQDDRHLQVTWHGGSPVRHLAGAAVWLSAGDGVIATGRLRQPKIHERGYGLQSAVVEISDSSLRQRLRQARRLFGGFDFRKPVWRSGKRIYTRAADDLVGVFALLMTARDLFRRHAKGPLPFLGLLTRAEEVGFVGAVAHLELGWLEKRRRPVMAVSLEASRTLPGARIGKGPVVRLGDRRTLFDTNGAQLLSELAARLLPGGHQRRIMDGGACEATAAAAFGLPVIGLTLPLGNYHNQCYDGGADCPRPQGPAPEFVHMDDVDGLLKLCRGLMKPGLPWADPWQKLRTRLSAERRRQARLLAE